MKNLKKATVLAVIIAMQYIVTAPQVWTLQANDDKTVPVTWDTFVRAESDKYFKSYGDLGGFGKFYNIRQPTPIDQQNVIRMNRDTLYSIGVFDLTTPVTITKPDTGDRFQSMMVVNQDEYVPIPVAYKPRQVHPDQR